MTETDPPSEGAPPTRLDAQAPPTRLDSAGAPPTTLDGSSGEEGDTYVRLPAPLRGDYEALRDMASGGEGDLLLARHHPSGELRVVKIYRVDRRRDERALELLSSADPSHVVHIHDSGQHGGRWWEVMEYCEHGSLADLIAREGPEFSAERIERVTEEVATALVHVHELKIPHRDLKPANIMIRTLEPQLDLVLADFGLARVLDLSKEMHSRLVISAAYASPQATSSGAISPAMDWWSLGIIVAELAQGRNPFQLENGEWLSDRVIMDWISSRPIDLSGIEDERLASLCRGLTLRDDRHGHRWGAEEVLAWLAGENPPLAQEAEAPAATRQSASPFPFKDPASGRTRPFTDPVELAGALALDWEAACDLLSGAAAHRAEQRALRNFLRSLSLAEAEQILAEQDDVEERLVRLLVELDPQLAPTFRGFSVDREGLLALARAEGEGPKAALAAIFAERILLNYSRAAGHADLAELDAAWHEEHAAFEQTIEAARSQGEAILAETRERQAASESARSQILVALLDEGERGGVLARGAAIVADRSPRRERWFATLATAEARPDSPGRSLAFLALASIAARLADKREQEEREERDERERERRAEEKARRAELRAQLGTIVKREWWFVVVWSLAWAVVLMAASLPLTFAPPKADVLASIGAAWHYEWKSLAIGSVLVLVASIVYNLVRFRAGKPVLAASSFFGDFILLGLAMPALFIYGAARSGSAPPSTWSGAPYTVAAAFIAVVVIRLLLDRVPKPDLAKLAVLLVCVCSLGLAWLLAPDSDVPSRASQIRTDRRLEAAIPMPHCSPRPIAALPVSLFRNSLNGLVHCHWGGISGTFMAFRNRQLMDVFASQKEHAADQRDEGHAGSCENRSGAYTSTWFKEAHRNRDLGPFVCYGTGPGAVVEWADWRSNVFASITGRSRARLYRWWRQHSISHRFSS